jgi:predicted ABC-type ATPase
MNTTKKFTIFDGVNGAGKSTLFYSEAYRDLGIRLNSDEILHSLSLDWKDNKRSNFGGEEALTTSKIMFLKWCFV